MVVDPVIVHSARKHGVTDNDMLHAYRNPLRIFELDDLTMLIGPDESARLLEIGVAEAEGIEFLVHAMPARPKFLEQ
ncbi:MAG: hypothetical protein DRJ50_04400 [Actinobacteria bacterium]|nr:MAG: hypothetical protein DRJ50_04400 [Actinomycetota bacterium]